MKKGNTTDLNATIFEDTRSFVKDSTLHPYLVIFIGKDSGKRHALKPGATTIGRSHEADITIDDDWASRVHCVLDWKGEAFEIEDRDSTNGTYVNTLKISRTQVPPGVPIQVGHSLMKIEFKDEAELQLERNLKRSAFIDGLTGIFNRQYFMKRAEEELAFARRHLSQIGIIMMDIDHFKLVNDTYGHQMGDFVLNRFASIISGNKRPEDVFARYGGEEFIIMPRGELSKDGMHLHCERLRLKIEDSEFAFGETRVRVTISLGFHLAVIGNGGQQTSLDELIGKADEALYRAKELGRNRTENLL
ncbi:MAG: diguanylate cyclase [Desulfobacterales bacterium]|nr:MAG: diguanylate cyclase [Desulfobacterales bacterium]